VRRRNVRDEMGVIRKLDRVRARKCPKLVYASKKIAVATARRQSAVTGELIRAYHCFGCHGYHLGHPPGSRPARAP
jgi:hypothetical protein